MILLVDDDPHLTCILRDFLSAFSCDVTAAKNGVEGLRQIMASDFDIVLCDMVMPTFPGDKFYIAVERIKPRLCRRFIFMTGHKADPQWDIFIRKVGGMVLWKPFHLQELITTIRTVLRKARCADVHEERMNLMRSLTGFAGQDGNGESQPANACSGTLPVRP